MMEDTLAQYTHKSVLGGFKSYAYPLILQPSDCLQIKN